MNRPHLLFAAGCKNLPNEPPSLQCELSTAIRDDRRQAFAVIRRRFPSSASSTRQLLHPATEAWQKLSVSLVTYRRWHESAGRNARRLGGRTTGRSVWHFDCVKLP